MSANIYMALLVQFLVLSEAEPCPLSHYSGTVSVTNGGRTCKRWDQQSEFNSSLDFPHDSSVSAAENYCRQPDNDSLPWCYIKDVFVYSDWQYCDKQICGVNDEVCGGEFWANTGWLQLINGESNDIEYNRECLWTLLAVGDSVIELHFHDFHIEFHYICGKAFVQIDEDSVIHGRFCGRKPPPDIRSISQTLYIRYFSQAYLNRTGNEFTAYYSQVAPSTGVVTIENRTSYNSYVTDPNYQSTTPTEVLPTMTRDVLVTNTDATAFSAGTKTAQETFSCKLCYRLVTLLCVSVFTVAMTKMY